MKRCVLSFADDETLAVKLAGALGAEFRPIAWRRFPDGESLVRLNADLAGAEALICCSLHAPDPRMAALMFAARTAREFGAQRVGLLAPYLAYMRQDARFHPGEAISCGHFAAWLSWLFDWVLTVDPHLHRNPDLQPLFSVPAVHVSAMPAVAEWIAAEVERPVLIGPDSESAQWVQAVADRIGAPMQVLNKQRHGDRDVDVSAPDLALLKDHTPVLVDDIIASGHTLLEATMQLRALSAKPPVCVAVHGVFADGADRALIEAGAARLITCNTIPHPTNGIDVTASLLPELRKLLADAPETARR